VRRCVVVIPTYEEVENLPDLIPRVLAQDASIEILIVDDNSPDGTGKLADQLAQNEPRLHVLHRPRKEGLGPAYRAGIAEALRLGADLVIQMDADFSHPPEAIPILLREIEHCDVVMGSRYKNGITVINWPFERILLSFLGNAYVRFITRMPITDTTGGFRCIRRALLERIGFEHIRANGYAFQVEINYRFVHYGAHIEEVPFFFLDRTRGVSKLTKRIGLEALWVVWRLRIASLLGRI